MIWHCKLSIPLALVLTTGAVTGFAQTATGARPLPDAPPALLLAQNVGSATGTDVLKQASPDAGAANQQLTRRDTEEMAIKNNPRIRVGRLLALAQHQVVRETRAAELPTANASVTAVEAEEGSRISAGSLTASRLINHAGAGGSFTQLITDFGRTRNLVASSKLQEQAQNANALATTEDIVLATDQAFYNALQAQAMLKVAEQTVSTRQTTQTQVNEMTKNKLKSTLDLSFADVNLSQSKLLLLDAQNNADSTMAALDAVLGFDRQVTYELVDNPAPLQSPPSDVSQLIQLGLQQRPDLQALNYNQQAALKQKNADRDQMLPSISAAGTAGTVPVRADQYYTANWWGAIGVNVNIPVFNGFLYSAQTKEAAIRAEAAGEQGRDLRNNIVRDIRTSWLAANAAFQRVAVTQDLLKQANLALGLAQTRYKLGLSSIVELSQAELQQTDAAIDNTNARYQYRLSLATLNYQTGTAP
ncbi:TolC family protein [Acidobacterium sp. S8]|uniref:TolC family protein n=1 Tax=Acidobacterium sp. S8 TaxID=1641854 RepID=UPI0020B171DF|nr:TolC family protein [Acidobacterium sp. S8]